MARYISDLNGYMDMTVVTVSPTLTLNGLFALSIAGTWTGEITFQRSFDDGSTWKDVEAFTSNAERNGLGVGVDVVYRLKVTSIGTGQARVRVCR